MSYRVVTVDCTAPRGGQLELVMKAAELKRLLISVTRLSSDQRAEVLAALDALAKRAGSLVAGVQAD